MRLEVACVGALRDKPLAELAERYRSRLSRMARISVLEVPAAPGGLPPERARSVEAESLRRALRGKPATLAGGTVAVVALDERGDALSSRELSALLQELARRGLQRAAFLVGGDEGLDGGLLGEAERVLSLSRMTFTHEMARVLLLEQLYRAHAILAGHPYHRGDAPPARRTGRDQS